jgi:hypothetical protein
MIVRVAKCRVALVLVLAMMLAAAPVGPANAQELAWHDGDNALKNVDRFRAKLESAGFALQEGVFEYLDTVKECCQGNLPNALGNNPWPNAYITLRMPPPEGCSIPFANPWTWQLREDEAIVLIGRTPPPAAYFSYQTWVAVGDAINGATIRTLGRDSANRAIVYIITGHQRTQARVWAAAMAAGYPSAIINVETISPVIAPLGYGAKGSLFFLGHRVAVPEDEDATQAYIKKPPYRVFRVLPNVPFAADPVPVPRLRVRGTGRTEMELYPALKRLRQAILDKETRANLISKELDSQIWQKVLPNGQLELLEKPWVALQRNIFAWAATRDTNYIQTYPYFRLREGADEYVIAYGVNHHKTRKAVYSNMSVVAEPDREFGLVSKPNRDFGDSARRYLPNDPQADLLYAIKVARNCHGEEYCLEVKQPAQLDINGAHYDCSPPIDLDNAEMYIIFRAYMEPATRVGADDNELLWDRAIYFTAW